MFTVKRFVSKMFNFKDYFLEVKNNKDQNPYFTFYLLKSMPVSFNFVLHKIYFVYE